MRSFWKRLLTPPTYQDPKENRLATQLHYLLLSGIFITIFFPPLVYLTSGEIGGPLISSAMAVVVLILLRLLRRGQIHLVSWGIIISSYLAIMISLIFNGGIRDRAIITLVMLLALSGVILGERATVWLGGITAVLVIVMYVLEQMGLFIEPDNPTPVATDDLAITLIGIGITTTFLRQLLRQVVTSEEEAHLAKEKAEQANQAKSDFLANMSHELRTPLNAVLGYAQILARKTSYEPHETKQALTVIQDSGHHLLMLINNILDLAKIEAGKMELQPTAVYLPTFLDGIATIMQMRAEEKLLQFNFETSDGLPDGLLIDEIRLRQVLINLLGNAIKFTNEGFVTFRLTHIIDEATEETAVLQFEVIDSGIGIAVDKQAQIFQPFEQAQQANNQPVGTGLGLAISRQLIQAMGSDIQMESQPDQGSRFWFTLRLPTTAINAPYEQPTTQTIRGYAGSRRTILIIDDIAHNRSVLVSLLQPLGFAVLEAADGQTAVHLTHSQRPDLVLLDLVMPGMSGFEVIKEIRAHADLNDTILIAVSANVTTESRQQSLDLGCQAFLPKPVVANALFALLEKHLELSWHYDAVETTSRLDIVYPPAAELEILVHWAQMGDLTAVNDHATQLAQQDPQYLPFADQISHFADNFAEEPLLRFLQTMIGETG